MNQSRCLNPCTCVPPEENSWRLCTCIFTWTNLNGTVAITCVLQKRVKQYKLHKNLFNWINNIHWKANKLRASTKTAMLVRYPDQSFLITVLFMLPQPHVSYIDNHHSSAWTSTSLIDLITLLLLGSVAIRSSCAAASSSWCQRRPANPWPLPDRSIGGTEVSQTIFVNLSICTT